MNFPTGFENASSQLLDTSKVFEQELILLLDQESIKFLEFAAENIHSSDNWSLKLHGCIWESIVTPKDEMFVHDAW